MTTKNSTFPPPRDPGRASFCRGVELAGEQIAPGFGLFIQECVQRALARQGVTAVPLPPSPRRRRKEG
jgi:hypothetical protein